MAKRYQLTLTTRELLELDNIVRENIDRQRALSGHVFEWHGPEVATRHLSQIDMQRRILAALSAAASLRLGCVQGRTVDIQPVDD